jgi:hypothetical protein
MPATTTTKVLNLRLQPCGAFVPYAGNYPVFPVLRNGDLKAGADQSWTELVDGVPGQIIYPSAEVPRPVQRPGVPFLAWLGGVPNSRNTFQQSVELPKPYNIKVRFDSYTASEEDDCSADTAKVYADATVVATFGLCNSQETSSWTSQLVDLSSQKGMSLTLRFETVLNGSRNSNWFLTNFVLCSDDAVVPPGTPKCTN